MEVENMISLPLLKKEIKSNYIFILIFAAIITLYSTIIVTMYDPKMEDSLTIMAKSMPEVFEAFGMDDPGSSLIEFIANYLYGFILIVFPLIFVLILSNRLIAHYVDTGSMAYILATPNKRSKIAITQAFLMILGLIVLVVYATVLILTVSYIMFDEKINISRFISLNFGLFCLLLFFGGLAFLSACIFNETKLATGVASGLSVIFILIQMIQDVGDKMEWLKYLTPMTLFDSNALISGNKDGTYGVLILFALGLIMIILGIQIFRKRNLPL